MGLPDFNSIVSSIAVYQYDNQLASNNVAPEHQKKVLLGIDHLTSQERDRIKQIATEALANFTAITLQAKTAADDQLVKHLNGLYLNISLSTYDDVLPHDKDKDRSWLVHIALEIWRAVKDLFGYRVSNKELLQLMEQFRSSLDKFLKIDVAEIEIEKSFPERVKIDDGDALARVEREMNSAMAVLQKSKIAQDADFFARYNISLLDAKKTLAEAADWDQAVEVFKSVVILNKAKEKIYQATDHAQNLLSLAQLAKGENAVHVIKRIQTWVADVEAKSIIVK